MSSPEPLIEPTGTTAWRPNQAILRWHWLALGGLLGALVGLVLAQARPPRYEAAAELGIGIDVPRTPPLDPLTEIRTLDRAAAVLLSDQTLVLVQRQVLSSPAADSLWSDLAQLRGSLRLDRMAGTWKLVGIAADPHSAAVLADAWLEVSIDQLDAAMVHAWRALELQSAPIVVACSEMAHGAPVEFLWECLAAGPSPGPTVVEELRREIELSRGVLPVLSYTVQRQADPPGSPVVWARGPLVAGGALFGVILGFAAASLRPEPLSRRARTPAGDPANPT